MDKTTEIKDVWEHIGGLQDEFTDALRERKITQGMQYAMNKVDLSKENDPRKVIAIQQALCAITILDAIKVDESLKEAFMKYATALAVQVIVEELDIKKAIPDGLPPELQAILDLFSKRI